MGPGFNPPLTAVWRSHLGGLLMISFIIIIINKLLHNLDDMNIEVALPPWPGMGEPPKKGVPGREGQLRCSNSGWVAVSMFVIIISWRISGITKSLVIFLWLALIRRYINFLVNKVNFFLINYNSFTFIIIFYQTLFLLTFKVLIQII